MTFSRPLATLVAALALLLWAAPAGATESGGAAVPSFDDSGGGIVAPVPEPQVDPVPVAEATQETPTTPEGEKQPPDEEGPPPDEEVPDEETPGPGDTPGDDGGAGGESADGSLPSTGLELAALSATGLGLLLAGGALWPTSSWPPPRDRLSRSMPRR